MTALPDPGAFTAPPLPLQTCVQERFVLQEVIGRGASGAVYRAHDGWTGRTVAVKVMPNLAPEHLPQVRHEISALRMLRLPGVVRLLEDGRHQQVHYLAMDFIQGRPFPSCHDPLPWDQLRELALNLLEVLAQVHHTGIIHRDLKPANILVHDNNSLTLVDFGLSTGPALEQHQNNQGRILGTPAYLAPEQIRGNTLTPATDLYAVGVILYEAISGHSPFPNDEGLISIMRSRLRRIPEVPVPRDRATPRPILELIRDLIQPDPAKRPQNALQLLSSFRGHTRRINRDPPMLDRREIIEQLTQAALQGRSLTLWGASGMGKTRCLREVRDLLLEQQRKPIWLQASQEPLGSLRHALRLPDPEDHQSLEDLTQQILQHLEEHSPHPVLLVDEDRRLDIWSLRLLEQLQRRCSVLRVASRLADAQIHLTGLKPEALQVLFLGPERIRHIPSRAAEALWYQSAGNPRQIARVLRTWQRLGLIQPEGDRYRVSYETLDQLRTSSSATRERDPQETPAQLEPQTQALLRWVGLAWPHSSPMQLRQLTGWPLWEIQARLETMLHQGLAYSSPQGSYFVLDPPAAPSDPEAQRQAHLAIARILPSGTPERLSHLMRAHAYQEVIQEALFMASRAQQERNPLYALHALEEALRIARILSDPAQEEALLQEWFRLISGTNQFRYTDRLLLELSRVRHPSHELQRLERFVRLTQSPPTDQRRLEALEALGPFEDPELESHRLQMRIFFSGRDPEAAQLALRDFEDWAATQRHPAVQRRLQVAHSRLAYSRGDFLAAAEHASQNLHPPNSYGFVLAAINTLVALVEVPRLEQAQQLITQALEVAQRLGDPMMECKCESLQRQIHYRAGQDSPPDQELLEAAPLMQAPVHEALLYLQEAAFAWRVGLLDQARELALRAARGTMESNAHSAAAMALALAQLCGHRLEQTQRDLIGEILPRLSARLCLQVLGMLALASEPAPPHSQTWVERHRQALQHLDPDQRWEILSLRETYQALSPDAPG